MKPSAQPNLDFVRHSMSSRVSTRKSREYPRLVMPSTHLTPEDAELLQASRWGDPQNVVDSQDGFTLHRTGLWTMRDDAAFEARMAHLSELGHLDGFVAAMRKARDRQASTFRFDDGADTVEDLPIGGYEPGMRGVAPRQ